MEIYVGLSAFLVGLGVGWIVASRAANRRIHESEGRAAAVEGQFLQLSQAHETLKQERDTREEEVRRLTAEKSALASQRDELEKMQSQLKEQFELLSRRLLEETSRKFQAENHTKLEEVVAPLQRAITDFRLKVEQVHTQQTDYHGQLKNELANLRMANARITDEAENLVKALKGDTQTQGVWGEMILENILQRSGLQRGVEYDVQVASTSGSDEDGDRRRIRPDIVVYYPEQKGCLIIDSKVSLTAYERYCSAADEAEREEAAKAHLRSIRTHVQTLAAKNYQNLHGLQSPDFILMFIPIEPALGLAQRLDAGLYEWAFDKNIVLITPSTLLTTLRLVRFLWMQQRQNANALEIAERGGRLIDKFLTVYDELQNLDAAIAKSAHQSRKVLDLVQHGRGSLVRQVEMLRDLGAKASKPRPQLPGEDEEETLPFSNPETAP